MADELTIECVLRALKADARWPDGYAKPILIVPDHMVEALQDFWGPGVQVIEQTDIYVRASQTVPAEPKPSLRPLG